MPRNNPFPSLPFFPPSCSVFAAGRNTKQEDGKAVRNGKVNDKLRTNL
jgi:hypothetical protein